MARSKKLEESDLKAIIAQQIALAETDDSDTGGKDRTAALEYVRGVMKDTPHEKGRSEVVSRDVADTVAWILPGVMRVFTATDRMAEASPTEESDQNYAEQATDGINYEFWKENNGYEILLSATYDALTQRNAIVKVWRDETPETTMSFHSGLSEEDLAVLEGDKDVRILAATESEDLIEQADPETGGMIAVPVKVFEVKIERKVTKGRVAVTCIPREDYGKNASATSPETARFQYHRCIKTRSELIEMNFKPELVAGLALAGDKEEDASRNDQNDNETAVDHSTEEVELYECYFDADVDGDGVSEPIRAYYAGAGGAGKLLEWEVWEDGNVFFDIPCTPIPHQFEAESIFDETKDIQKIKTVLMRQALDNIYAANLPTRYAEQNSVINPDALFSPGFGEVVWVKKGAQLPQEAAIPFVAENAFHAMDYFDQVKQQRTGVNRQTAALDSQALTNQSATANQNERDASYSQIEQIARDMAELGWSRVFKAILKLMVKHQDKPKTIRLRNEWVQVDPRYWNANMDVTINVGLGSGSRDRDLAHLQGIFQTQNMIADKLAGAGLTEEAIDMLPRLTETATKMVESTGIKLPELYIPDLDDEKMKAIKGKLAEKAKAPPPEVMMEMQKAQVQQAAAAQKAQSDANIAATKANNDLIIAREKLAAEMALKEKQILAEMALKRDQLAGELSLKRELAMMGAPTNGATSGVHMGGEPG